MSFVKSFIVEERVCQLFIALINEFDNIKELNINSDDFIIKNSYDGNKLDINIGIPMIREVMNTFTNDTFNKAMEEGKAYMPATTTEQEEIKTIEENQEQKEITTIERMEELIENDDIEEFGIEYHKYIFSSYNNQPRHLSPFQLEKLNLHYSLL